MISIPDVTLVSVTGVRADDAHEAMLRSLAGLEFGQALLLSTDRPAALDSRIHWEQIPPLTIAGYNQYILTQLHTKIATSHALIVQADGYVLRPGLWNDEWLSVDYIGAPWPPYLRAGSYTIELTNRVGNGGFSLRSRKLLQTTASIGLRTLRFPTRAEDVITCHLLYDYLRSKGIRFADLDTAMQFSIEKPQSDNHSIGATFGFHGKHHAEAIRTIR